METLKKVPTWAWLALAVVAFFWYRSRQAAAANAAYYNAANVAAGGAPQPITTAPTPAGSVTGPDLGSLLGSAGSAIATNTGIQNWLPVGLGLPSPDASQ